MAPGDTPRDPRPEPPHQAESRLLEPATPLRLEHGAQLDEPRIAWSLAGSPDRPPVVALGGISADRFIHLRPGGDPGWWHVQARAGGALDPRRYRLIGMDYLGSGESSRPRRLDEWAVTPADQARAVLAVLDELELATVHLVGASYGGMVALALARLAPERVAGLAVLCAAHRAAPLASGYRAVQRDIVRLGAQAGQAARGVELARALAMLGFRTGEEFRQRFAAPPVLEGQRARLPLEDYLDAQGRRYAERTEAASFLCLSQSCDLLHLDPAELQVPLSLFGARSDRVVPPEDLLALAQGVGDLRGLELVDSLYGHDAFLKESAAVEAFLRAFLPS